MANQIPRPTDNPIRDNHRAAANRQREGQGENEDQSSLAEFFSAEDESVTLQRQQVGTLERLEDIQNSWTEKLTDIAENIEQLVTAQNQTLEQTQEQQTAQARTERQSSMFGGGDDSAEGGEGIIAGAQNMGGRLMTMIRSILRLGSMIFLPALGGLMLLMRTLGNEKVQDLIVGIRDLWTNKVWPFFEHMWKFTDTLVKELEAGLGRMMDNFDEGKVVEGIVRIPGALVDAFVASVGSIIRLIGSYFDINWMEKLGTTIQENAGALTNIVVNVVKDIVGFLERTFMNFFTFGGEIKAAFDKNGLKGAILEIPKAAFGFIIGQIKNLTTFLDDLFGTNMFGDTFQTVKNSVTAVVNTVGNIIDSIIGVYDDITSIDPMKEIKSFAEDLSNKAEQIGKNLKQWWNDTIGVLFTADFWKEKLSSMVEGVVDSIPGLSAASDFFSGRNENETDEERKKRREEATEDVTRGAQPGQQVDPKEEVKNTQEERTKNRDKKMDETQKGSSKDQSSQREKGSSRKGGGSPTVIDYSSTNISSSSQTAAVATRPNTTPARMRNSVLEMP